MKLNEDKLKKHVSYPGLLRDRGPVCSPGNRAAAWAWDLYLPAAESADRRQIPCETSPCAASPVPAPSRSLKKGSVGREWEWLDSFNPKSLRCIEHCEGLTMECAPQVRVVIRGWCCLSWWLMSWLICFCCDWNIMKMGFLDSSIKCHRPCLNMTQHLLKLICFLIFWNVLMYDEHIFLETSKKKMW